MENSPYSWEQMIDGLRAGDPDVCTSFWKQYGPLLEAVAQRQLSDRLQRRLGPEDVVQSACRTFFRRVSDNQFRIADANDLWRLMCAITMNKARRAARDQSRQKRGLHQEQYLNAGSDEESAAREPAGSAANPMELAQVADQMQALLQVLTGEECEVLDLKLQQFTNEEIAQKLNCSERTVRRLTKKIQSGWTSLLDD